MFTCWKRSLAGGQFTIRRRSSAYRKSSGYWNEPREAKCSGRGVQPVNWPGSRVLKSSPGMRHFLNKNAFFQRSLAHVMSGFTLVLRFSRAGKQATRTVMPLTARRDLARAGKLPGHSCGSLRKASSLPMPTSVASSIWQIIRAKRRPPNSRASLITQVSWGICPEAHSRIFKWLAPTPCKATLPRLTKAAYQDFLTLWKDADPDIPILKQGTAEHAKLQ